MYKYHNYIHIPDIIDNDIKLASIEDQRVLI